MKSNDILGSEVWEVVGFIFLGFFVIPILKLFVKLQEILSVNIMMSI